MRNIQIYGRVFPTYCMQKIISTVYKKCMHKKGSHLKFFHVVESRRTENKKYDYYKSLMMYVKNDCYIVSTTCSSSNHNMYETSFIIKGVTLI